MYEQEILPTPLELFGTFFFEDMVQIISVFQWLCGQTKCNCKYNFWRNKVLYWNFYWVATVLRRRMYWQNDRNTYHSFMSNAMRRDRFEFILRNLHFVNNNSTDNTDKFPKFRPLINMLNKNFQTHAPQTTQHSVDEQMVPYFGSYGCKQYIHGKPIRYGYKFWVGATYKGYIIWLKSYQGAWTFPNNIYKEMGLGPSVVLT